MFIFFIAAFIFMMYGMFGEQILNNVLFALKRADNLPTDIYGAFKQKTVVRSLLEQLFLYSCILIPHVLKAGIVKSSISITLI